MGCTGCLLNEREKQQAIDSAGKKAKDYAVEINKLVVLYWLDETTVSHMEADAAKSAGIQPIQYISPLRPNADGGVY